MKIIYLIIFPFLLGFATTYGQVRDFSAIDIYAKSIPYSEARTVENLSRAITKNAKTDIEKVRAIFIWISHNIAYDIQSFRSGNVPEQTAEIALAGKKAVCQGYSELFYRLCKLNKIECVVIQGYSKGFGYVAGKKFTQTDHAWNVVKINNEWKLMDATWGAGYVDENNNFINAFTEEYFSTSPSRFIIKHFPMDPMWQLLPMPVSLKTFEKDSNTIKQTLIAIKDYKTVNYIDTLKSWERLDSVGRMLNSNLRMTRFNPENSEAWYKLGWYYFTLAWQRMSKLNDVAVQRNKSLSKPLAEEARTYLNSALLYLDKVNTKDPFYAEDVLNKKKIIGQNQKNLEKIINR